MSGIDKYRYTGTETFKIKNFDTSDIGEFTDREEAVDEFVENLRAINKTRHFSETAAGILFHNILFAISRVYGIMSAEKISGEYL